MHQSLEAIQARISRASSLFLLQILILENTLGFAGTPDVHPHGSIAVTGIPRVGQFIAVTGAVTLAVGQVLEDRRNRLVSGVLRQPDAGRQPGAVRQFNPRVLDDLDPVGKSVTTVMSSAAMSLLLVSRPRRSCRAAGVRQCPAPRLRQAFPECE